MNLIKIKLSMMFLLILAYNCYAVDNLCFDVLWFGKVPKADAKAKGWRQSGNVLKTFDMTDRQVADILKSHGFSEKNHSETKKNMKRCKISLWRKTDCQIIVMLVEQEIGKTLFSWGVINDAK